MKSSSCARVKLVKIKPNMLHKERARHSAKPEWSPIHQNHQSATKTETREPIMSQQSFRTVSDRAKLHHSKYDHFNRKQHPDASAPCWETSNCILGQRKAACWGSLPTRSDLSTKTPWRFPLCYFWLLINSFQICTIGRFSLSSMTLSSFNLNFLQWKSEKFNDSWNIFQQS